MVDSGVRCARQTASCRTGCRPASRAARSSPCRTFGSRPGAPRTPARPGCRRRTGRGSAGACGRTSPTACGHSTRRLFFSPPNERDHPCPGVTEHTLDRRLRTKAGEPIGIEQAPGTLRGSSHRQSVPDFSAPLKPAKRCPAGAATRSTCGNHPHVSTKSLYSFAGSCKDIAAIGNFLSTHQRPQPCCLYYALLLELLEVWHQHRSAVRASHTFQENRPCPDTSLP